MPSPSQMVETTLSFAENATAEQHVSANDRYSTIVVVNNSNVPMSVAVDGGTATATGSNEQEIPAGGEYTFDNELGLWNSNLNAGQTATNFQSGASGGAPLASAVKDQSLSIGWTAQQGFAETGSTYASVIPTAATSSSAITEVTVTFQD